MTESNAPKVIWITHDDTGASLSGSFRVFRASSLDHGSEYARYIRADATELVALVDALREYKEKSRRIPFNTAAKADRALAQWEALQ